MENPPESCFESVYGEYMLIAERNLTANISGKSKIAVLGLHDKLFFIRMFFKNYPAISQSNFLEISSRILAVHGISISPSECEFLIKKYRFLITRPYYGPILLATLSCVWLFFTSHLSPVINLGFLILCWIFLCSIYINSSIALSSFYFNRRELVPSLHPLNENFCSITITIVIASRNEPFPVAKLTFESALNLEYPSAMKEIIVVDNSDVDFPDYELWRDYVQSFQGRSDVKVLFIHRDGVDGFKPRNLDIALQHTTSDYLLYLDVDSTLAEDTLLRTMPIFQHDSSLAFIQLQSVPSNAKGKSALALPQGIYNYFLRFGTIFLSHCSHTLFYGHNAIWRTSVARELGNCLEYYRDEVVVTEDLSMSLRAVFKGYYGTGVWVHSGEWVPESLRETEAMWLRWTVGTFQVYAKHWREICRLCRTNPHELWGWILHIGTLINQGLIPIYVIVGLYINSVMLMFVAAVSLVPEILQTIFSYYKLRLSNVPKLKKLLVCYSGNLVLGSFLNWVRFVGLIRFVTRRQQGWVPTGKSSCGKISFSQLIRERYGFLLFGLSSVLLSLYSLVYSADDFVSVAVILFCGLHGLHSLLAVLVFGRSTMQEGVRDAVKQGHVNDYTAFYD